MTKCNLHYRLYNDKESFRQCLLQMNVICMICCMTTKCHLRQQSVIFTAGCMTTKCRQSVVHNRVYLQHKKLFTMVFMTTQSDLHDRVYDDKLLFRTVYTTIKSRSRQCLRQCLRRQSVIFTKVCMTTKTGSRQYLRRGSVIIKTGVRRQNVVHDSVYDDRA